jgi:hypothetical protein
MILMKFFSCSWLKIAGSSRESVTRFHFWVRSLVCETHRRWNFFSPRSSRRILKHVVFATLDCRTVSLYDKNGRSSSIAEIPVATSLSPGLLDRESFGSLVLRTRKRADHLYTIEKVTISLWYTDSSSEWIYWTASLLSVKKRMTILCSIVNCQVQTSISILQWLVLDEYSTKLRTGDTEWKNCRSDIWQWYLDCAKRIRCRWKIESTNFLTP